MKVIVVGAGLAGLTCAKVLAERGTEVVVFEVSDGVGGRVRTDEKDGFLLDRGFQVYFTAYPIAGRHLDHATLNLKPFDLGAIVQRGHQESDLSDPLRDSEAFLPSLLLNAAAFSDKLLTLKLAARSIPERMQSAGELDSADSSSLEYLRGKGFSERIIGNFYRLFSAGSFWTVPSRPRRASYASPSRCSRRARRRCPPVVSARSPNSSPPGRRRAPCARKARSVRSCGKGAGSWASMPTGRSTRRTPWLWGRTRRRRLGSRVRRCPKARLDGFAFTTPLTGSMLGRRLC